jgi:hypothetical protein
LQKTRGRLTYANVISSLCLFLLLGGGAAYAASQLGKNSVGKKQLKANAVTTAKIKKNAVTAAKIKNGAVNGEKVADGSLTGADINGPSTPFTQAVYRFHQTAQASFEGAEPAIYPLGSYTQPAGQDDQIVAGLTVNFSASCEPERSAVALLFQDPPANLSEFNPEGLIAIAFADNNHSGSATVPMEFTSFPLIENGGGALNQVAPAAPVTHSYAAFLVEGGCKSGSGVTATGGLLDILGTK